MNHTVGPGFYPH